MCGSYVASYHRRLNDLPGAASKLKRTRRLWLGASMKQNPRKQGESALDDEPDVTMNDGGEREAGEDPDFDEAGEGVPDAPRDEDR